MSAKMKVGEAFSCKIAQASVSLIGLNCNAIDKHIILHESRIFK